MKIYFAGSIRGGREDRELYSRLIAYMSTGHRVLTEHIGHPVLEESGSDGDIYRQDTAWLRECDLVIAECTRPSLGVGYELAYAERYGKPVHILYNTERTRLSAMLTGNPAFYLHPYTEEADLFPLVDRILGNG
ncbi:MAG: nucleoside 2-deoxyribosyltransferase [Clostridia bacterium]|nr:nucleoside 2-deoxyribosyltransferase [Clostridia bacterium]